MRWYHLLFLSSLPAFATASCDSAPENLLCTADSNVFCRCRGGGAGTKKCNAAGDGFATGCETDSGTCEEVVEDPDNPTGAGGNDPMPAPPGEFLGPCSEDADCKDGNVCPMGYCTKPCADYKECGDGDCISWEGSGLCMPYCVVQDHCEPYGMASRCGFTDDALPPFQTIVCANWGDSLELPPDGFPLPEQPCDDDKYCNLGLPGVERVCSDSGCTDGCHIDEDCSAATCSESGGALGTCGTTTMENGDDCPGIPISLSLSMPDASVNGDTGDCLPPSEHECSSPCFASMNPPSEELVYAVTISEGNGCIFSAPCTLTALLSTTDQSFDAQLYAREVSCDGNLQLTSSDEVGGGLSEIIEFPVFDGETFWIFVDGWQGSTGSFQLDVNLGG
jgi:hypothetical protein